MPSKSELKQEIKKILQAEIKEPFQGFIFGSQANLQQFKAADIDLGIETKSPLGYDKLLSIKSKLDSLPTLHPIDLVDFSEVDEDFKKVALTNIEIL